MVQPAILLIWAAPAKKLMLLSNTVMITVPMPVAHASAMSLYGPLGSGSMSTGADISSQMIIDTSLTLSCLFTECEWLGYTGVVGYDAVELLKRTAMGLGQQKHNFRSRRLSVLPLCLQPNPNCSADCTWPACKHESELVSSTPLLWTMGFPITCATTAFHFSSQGEVQCILRFRLTSFLQTLFISNQGGILFHSTSCRALKRKLLLT